jgi:biopolymer transport protein ExbD
MAMGIGKNDEFASEINITPLVDVVLVLLIIFMMIVPVMLRGYDLDIPGERVAAAPGDRDVEQVVLEIELASCPVVDPPRSAGLPGGCRVTLGGEPVEVAGLARRVGEVFGPRDAEHRVLFLAVDDSVNYEAVLRILDAARSSTTGLRIGLVN